MTTPPSPPPVTCPCRSSRCLGKIHHPLNQFHVKKNGQLSATCISCSEKDAEYRRKRRKKDTLEDDVNEEEEIWSHLGLEEFLDELADAPACSIEYKVTVDTSEIIGSDRPSRDRARAIAEAIGEATSFHWM